MSDDKDSFDYMYTIRKQIQEDEENFIYTTILPFCETITEKRLNKAELEEILHKGMRNSHLLDKVKDVREKIQHFIDVCDSDTVAGANMKSGLCIALEEVNKLIESEEKE